MGRKGTGVELREHSIRIGFVYQGQWTRETLKIPPTPANQKHAARLVAQINRAIADGSFIYEHFFPESPRAARSTALLFGDACDTWLKTKGRLATKTLNQYRNALEVWKGLLGANTPVAKLTHATVAAKIGAHPWASPKLLNNYLIALRGVFRLAGREIKGLDNPMDGIENSRHQAPPPDPLTAEEAGLILAQMRRSLDIRVWAYFAFAFATGMRPEEIIALRWSDLDARTGTIRVERAKTAGEIKPLKTYHARDVDLTDQALAALAAMRPLTGLAAAGQGEIFQNPVTGRPWHDERSQRDHYWRPVLRGLGIRWRRPYNTRHTYATTALMAGANPAYISRQMGHKSAKMLFTVYAKWIDGADRGRERDKLNAAQNISHQFPRAPAAG